MRDMVLGGTYHKDDGLLAPLPLNLGHGVTARDYGLRF